MTMKKRFLSEISKPEDQIDLEHCALLFAAQMQLDLNIEEYTLKLDEQVNAFLAAAPDFHEQAPFNAEYLVGVVGDMMNYAGDSVEYYAPDNSLLNRVIDTRLGIPISLAAIYMAVGKRLGIEVKGVGFPAHFLIRVTEPDKSKTIIDPFAHLIITDRALEHMKDAAKINFGGFDARWLLDVHPHDFLMRQLENLKGAYMRLNELENAEMCLSYQLLIRPDDRTLLGQLQAFVDRSGEAGNGAHRLN